jgi:hypothetical protein
MTDIQPGHIGHNEQPSVLVKHFSGSVCSDGMVRPGRGKEAESEITGALAVPGIFQRVKIAVAILQAQVESERESSASWVPRSPLHHCWNL